MITILEEAESFIRAQELCATAKKGRDEEDGQNHKKKEGKKGGTWYVASSSKDGNSQSRKREFNNGPKFEYTKDLFPVFKEIRSKVDIDDPTPLRSAPEERDPNKYCHFHKAIGHHTNDCFNLKRVWIHWMPKGRLVST